MAGSEPATDRWSPGAYGSLADAYDIKASHHGDQIAAVGDGSQLTWRELSERSDALALHMFRLGVYRGDLALIHLPNSPELCLVRLACDKAGVRSVLVSPSFRTAELDALLAHVGPTLAFCSAQRGFDAVEYFSERMAGGCPQRVVAVDGAAGSTAIPLDEISATAPDGFTPTMLKWTRFAAAERSQILTSSGTTGIPKCIEQSTAARMATAEVWTRRWALSRDEVLGVFAPAVSGTSEALGLVHLPHVARKIVYVHHFDPVGFCERVAEHGITVAIMVPTMISRLASSGLVLPRSLRLVVSYGAPIPVAAARTLEERRSRAKIVQNYGTVDFGGIAANAYDDTADVRWTTVGKVLDGNDVQIRDAAGAVLPSGSAGHLFVRGVHSSAGYFRDPERLARSVRTGFWEVGDIARQDEDGNLRIVSRSDDVIIRGGQNVYPGDIEEMLTRHAKVAAVAVLGLPDADLGEIVCACVVLQPGARCTSDELLSFLNERGVGRFKFPARWHFVQELPRNASGLKVDRQRLKAMLLRMST